MKVNIQVTGEELSELDALAVKRGVSRSRAIVDLALYSVDSISPEELRQLLVEISRMKRQLVGIATNLNQMAHHANATQDFPAAATVTRKQVARLIPELEELMRSIGRVSI